MILKGGMGPIWGVIQKEKKGGGEQPSEFKDVQIVKYSEMQGPPEA